MPKKILLRYLANYISLRLQKLLTGRVMLCEMKPVSCEEMYHTQAYCCYHLRWRLLTAESTPFPQRLTTPSENGEERGTSSVVPVTWQELWQAGKEQFPESTLAFVVLDLGI